MHMKRLGETMRYAVALFAVTALLTVGVAHGQPTEASQGPNLQELARYIPAEMNTLAVLRIDEVLQTPRAKSEGWADTGRSQFLQNAANIPPGVSLVIRAFEFHLENSHVSRTLGLGVWPRPLGLSGFLKQTNGHFDTVASLKTVRAADRGYVVQLKPNVLARMTPGHRQEIARWIQGARAEGAPGPSAFLDAALNSKDQIVLAYDMQDMVDPGIVRKMLGQTATLGGTDAIDSVARLLERIQGVRLTIHVDKEISGQIVIEFAGAIGGKPTQYIKPLLLEVLSNSGAYLEDLDSSTIKLDGSRAILDFGLSDVGFRQVMSLVTAPATEDTSTESTPEVVSPGGKPVNPPPSTNDKAQIAKNRNYYTAVIQCLDDLQNGGKKRRNYEQMAVWHENFAKKIEGLSIDGIDPELQEYGAHVSSNLRALAVSLRGVPIEVNRLNNSVTYDVNYYPPTYGFTWGTGFGGTPAMTQVNTNQGQIRAEQASVVAAGEKQREQVWNLLNDERQQLRQKLQQKYGTDFEGARR